MLIAIHGQCLISYLAFQKYSIRFKIIWMLQREMFFTLEYSIHMINFTSPSNQADHKDQS